MAQPTPAEQDAVVRIGTLLRYGVLLAATVLGTGGAIYLSRHWSEEVPNRRAFEPVPPEFSRPGPIAEAALAGRGRAIIQLGLLVLIATPVLRVAFSVVVFARQRDYYFVAFTLIVLAVLILGFVVVPPNR